MKKTHKLTPLKNTPPGLFNPPAASSLAHGLNIGTVVSMQNHWREYYNPLPGMNIQRARALYDFSRRGLNAELQNVYREMEGLFPTLIGLIERRTSPLLEMDWACKTMRSQIAARARARAWRRTRRRRCGMRMREIDNLYEAIEWLELGAFRGYAHLGKNLRQSRHGGPEHRTS